MHGTSERKPTLRLIAAVGGLAALIGREVSGQRSVSRAASTIARRVRPWSWRTACAAVAAALACTMLAAPPAQAVSVDGTLDTAFSTANGIGTIFTHPALAIAVQSDGKILVGGANRTSNPNVGGKIARLNTDGTRDTTFTTNASAALNISVTSIAVQSDGKILVGGYYRPDSGGAAGTAVYARLVRLNTDGTLDTAFTNATGTTPGTVYSIAVQSDGKILVGGGFSYWNTISVGGGIVRLNTDGTRDMAFTTANGTGANSNVYSVAVQSDGAILLGGIFTAWNSTTVNRLVRLGNAPLVVSSVLPVSGPVAGGTLLSVTGTGFVAGATVTVGGAACGSVVVVSATSVTCSTPAGSAGARDVVVTNPAPSSGAGTGSGLFTFYAPPAVSAVSPVSGAVAGGSPITVTGTGFLVGATVTVGGAACSVVVVVSPTSVTCSTPAGTTGAGRDVVVTNPAPSSLAGTGSALFTFYDPPVVSAVSPVSGSAAGATPVTVTGTGFVTGATVTVGGAACSSVVAVSSTSVTCTTPAGTAGAGRDVVVTNPAPSSLSGTGSALFTYTSSSGGGGSSSSTPVVSSVSPVSGSVAGGSTVTVTGSGFEAGATVTVGGAACASVVVVSTT